MRHRKTERQLSEKKLKKKGLEELERVLAELGDTQREPNGHDDSHETLEPLKQHDPACKPRTRGEVNREYR
ncbi:hypothetical protein VNO78_02683 [Psophocarpus tetragonolobus]|uniref:Uncharacterized protein n=1 Tax=Psophocarpus tetragonolobus TaxID=3891 RepID=A0AAN9T0R0_PSOTE